MEIIVKTNQIRRHICDPYPVTSREKLFVDIDGEDVRNGDTVSFYLPDECLPFSGVVENYKGTIRVATFVTLLNKFRYYTIKQIDEAE